MGYCRCLLDSKSGVEARDLFVSVSTVDYEYGTTLPSLLSSIVRSVISTDSGAKDFFPLKQKTKNVDINSSVRSLYIASYRGISSIQCYEIRGAKNKSAPKTAMPFREKKNSKFVLRSNSQNFCHPRNRIFFESHQTITLLWYSL